MIEDQRAAIFWFLLLATLSFFTYFPSRTVGSFWKKFAWLL